MLGGLGLALSLAVAPPAYSAELTLSGRLTLVSEDPAFGGLSAIEVSRDGQQAIMLSDRGDMFHATLERRAGRVYSATVERMPEQKVQGDSEGLAIARDGQWYVSTEGPARLLRLPGARLPDHPHFPNMANNRALEALAVDAKGHLYTLPETTRRAGPFPIYRWDGTAWEIIHQLERRGPFRPVGADFGPDGRLYVLERAFDFSGFRTRVRRLVPGRDAPAETLLSTPGLTHDNLEGIAVWRDDRLHLRVTLVSDDNFRSLQRTEIVEYVLID